MYHMDDTCFGKAALVKLSPVHEGFHIYEAENLGGKNGMKVTGAIFREAKSGPRKGEQCVMIPGSKQVAYVSCEEIQRATTTE